jgi:hypothetical protein
MYETSEMYRCVAGNEVAEVSVVRSAIVLWLKQSNKMDLI